MSVIQKIRDKYATVMIVVVVIALLAFLLMDAFVGPKSLFHRSTDVGEVDGQSLDYRDFVQQLQVTENMYRNNMPEGTSIDDATRQRLRDQVWQKFLTDVLFGKEYEQLGIGFTDAEMRDITVTSNADPQIQAIPAFHNQQTGQFDPNMVIEFLRQLSAGGAANEQVAQQRAQWMQLEDYLRNASLQRKLFTLVRQAVYVPKWLEKEQQEEQSAQASISYVNVPYTTISDSAVKVTDAELQSYLNAHQALYHREASRRIEYVSFDAVPTAADTAAVMTQLAAVKPEFDTVSAENMGAFIARSSEMKFYDGYVPESMMQIPEKDSITTLPVGGIYGPFHDNGMVSYVRMVDKKMMPDSVKVRHILISTQQTPDSIARQRIDSIEQAVKGGADFGQLVLEYSDDPGSKQNGGEYDLTPMTNFIPEFKDFAFEHKPGELGVVKSQQYGYFLIQVLSRGTEEPAYKVAFLAKRLDPSEGTENVVYGQASEFAGKYATRAQFDKAVREEGLNKKAADNIHTTDYVIPGIGQARELIQWAFNEKTELGDRSSVFSLGEHYVIAVLTGIQEEGLANLGEVRAELTAAVRKEKKGKQIAGKIGNASTLDAVSKSTGQQVQQAQNISFATPFIPNAGFEPRIVGAAFRKDLAGGKVSPALSGNNGVFVLKVDSLQHITPAAATAQDQQQEAMLQQTISGQLLEMLRKEAKIKDERLKYF
ncbi:peptidylprolyl isomerase [Compostibacter hankyongensis]|uniref:Periplasmic chaperone PpiD n=1 Tax=Compostibacter hankyongensis TaxID=1007089 RepID=A0ABP8FCH6_9BACT